MEDPGTRSPHSWGVRCRVVPTVGRSGGVDRSLEVLPGGEGGQRLDVLEVERLCNGSIGHLSSAHVEAVHEVRIGLECGVGSLVGQRQGERQGGVGECLGRGA